jgi:hypothetical protein
MRRLANAINAMVCVHQRHGFATVQPEAWSFFMSTRDNHAEAAAAATAMNMISAVVMLSVFMAFFGLTFEVTCPRRQAL